MRVRHSYLILVACIVAGAILLIWGSQRNSVATPPIEPDNAEQVAQGQEIYDAYCASCHGANLEGQPNWRQRDDAGFLPAPPHDETGHTWHHPREQLFAITRDGVAAYAPPGYATTMRGFTDELTDEEIAAVIAYIISQWPSEIREQHRIRETAQ